MSIQSELLRARRQLDELVSTIANGTAHESVYACVELHADVTRLLRELVDAEAVRIQRRRT